MKFGLGEYRILVSGVGKVGSKEANIINIVCSVCGIPNTARDEAAAASSDNRGLINKIILVEEEIEVEKESLKTLGKAVEEDNAVLDGVLKLFSK